jgi:phosphoenolpyruvate carboxykinase (GTP)
LDGLALASNGAAHGELRFPEVPENLTDWQGNKWSKDAGRVAAHPNSRFTVALEQCPSVDPGWDSPDGVELDAILFGGRRATNVPLVVQSRDWNHGVFMGATISSEQTAAAEGVIGTLRRDPFAMLPFCGYNMADYWGNWLKIGNSIDETKRPKIFQVNWFRKDKDGKFMWPGFGENIRVLDWIINRLEDKVGFEESPIGLLPKLDQFNTEDLGLSAEKLAEIFRVDKSSWLAEADLIEVFFSEFRTRLPFAMSQQLRTLQGKLH